MGTFATEEFTYSVLELWKASSSLPVERYSTDKLSWLLGESVWATQTNPDLSPEKVLAHPTTYPNHTRRIQEADLAFPLLLMECSYPDRPSDEHVIVDGVHRLCAVIASGQAYVDVRILTQRVLAEGVIHTPNKSPTKSESKSKQVESNLLSLPK
jgi:hypothetical protein